MLIIADRINLMLGVQNNGLHELCKFATLGEQWGEDHLINSSRGHNKVLLYDNYQGQNR